MFVIKIKFRFSFRQKENMEMEWKRIWEVGCFSEMEIRPTTKYIIAIPTTIPEPEARRMRHFVFVFYAGCQKKRVQKQKIMWDQ